MPDLRKMNWVYSVPLTRLRTAGLEVRVGVQVGVGVGVRARG